MTDDELEAALEGFAKGLTPIVQIQLDIVAQQFATQVEDATELVAAVYSVSSIRRLWNERIPRVMTRLRDIFRRSARLTADSEGVPAPSPGELEGNYAAYAEAVGPLLEAVGDSLATAAQRTLTEGVNAGDSLDQLKARLITVFNDTGSQLGPVRADRIAQTESVRAFNAGTLAAAEVITDSTRPLVKQWVTRHDRKVRTPHRDADGQLQLLADPFDVGGYAMQYPGDPSAPAALTINCRCVLKATAPRERTASMATPEEDLASKMPPQLKAYWLAGPGAARIGWGTPGSFDRCVRELKDDFPQNPEGLCANLYKEATGRWPGQRAASETVHTGAMIALMPSEADAARLGKLSTEAEDQLHLTLFFLGEAADWPDGSREAVLGQVERASAWLAPVKANAFGVSRWNPASDAPAFVWNVGDTDPDPERPFRLADVHTEVRFALEEHGDLVPEQHSPWAPHVCAAYGEADLAALAEGCGPVTFDRIRVGFGGEYTDFPLVVQPVEEVPEDLAEAVAEIPVTIGWTTPDDTALAFENQQTGDGRVFAPGALYWDGDGPWPLMANENFDGHDDASLAGAIETLDRNNGRLTGTGCLYLTQPAGYEAAMLLSQGAPLGVSVDLDDVDVEVVDATGTDAVYRARLLRASMLPMPDGGFFLKGQLAPVMSASGTATITESALITFTVGPDGRVPGLNGVLYAAAGDADVAEGAVIDRQQSGDYLMRITRARVRGATLVTIPAFAGARITLADPEMLADGSPMLEEINAAIALENAGAPEDEEIQAAGWTDWKAGPAQDSEYARVLRHVRRSKAPVGPARVAQHLKIPVMTAQRLLAQAAARGEVVRLTRGLYTDSTSSARADHVMHDDQLAASGELVASVTGSVDMPVADRDTEWDGPGAETRVFEWADGDTDLLDRAFAYRDDSVDPTTKASRKLGYADVVDGNLVIIPRGVFAAEAAVNGARGGVDIPSDELGAVRERLASVRAHVVEETGDEEMDGMQASAWTAMAALPAMPAAWFREPTAEELPAGGAGVNYSNGRIFGWVAQANEPHAGYAKRIVINDLGKIDTTHFLRQRFTLDDGSSVKAGAFTMNAGHHRDGAECETASCQFDDTRTVAGIVTVGMNERGMWFSGAAAPWLSDWDRSVFMATQPSYHMKQGRNGAWQLRAVLAVPVPGHSSPLLASAVVERAQLALTAAATMAEVETVVAAETARQAADDVAVLMAARTEADLIASIDYDRLADSMVAALARAEDRRKAEAAELEALLAEARKMGGDTTDEGA